MLELKYPVVLQPGFLEKNSFSFLNYEKINGSYSLYITVLWGGAHIYIYSVDTDLEEGIQHKIILSQKLPFIFKNAIYVKKSTIFGFSYDNGFHCFSIEEQLRPKGSLGGFSFLQAPKIKRKRETNLSSLFDISKDNRTQEIAIPEENSISDEILNTSYGCIETNEKEEESRNRECEDIILRTLFESDKIAQFLDYGAVKPSKVVSSQYGVFLLTENSLC